MGEEGRDLGFHPLDGGFATPVPIALVDDEKEGRCAVNMNSEQIHALDVCDLERLESLLRVCQATLVLLGGDGPRARMTAEVVDGMLVGTVLLGMPVRGRFVLPQDWFLLAHLVQADRSASWCHGVSMGAGDALTVLPTGVSEFCFSAGSEVNFCLMPVKFLASAQSGNALDDRRDVLDSGVRHHPDAEVFQSRLKVALASGAVSGKLLMEWLMMHRQSQASHLETPLSVLRARRSRYQIFRRAEDFMSEHLRRHIYLQELCDASGASERTLRYAFEDMVGVSPARYLSLMRLCGACRALLEGDAAELSVKSVALDCGLWDLSRFADSYRRVFGELPSDTLQRRDIGQ